MGKIQKENSLLQPNFEKVYSIFGKEKGLEMLVQEYRDLSNTELEITKLRWTVYTAFLAVSLTLSGYIWSNPNLDPLMKKIGLGGGAFVNLIACYFYWWFHRTALMYREHLKALEEKLGFERYSIRLNRPKIGPITLRFYWGILILLVVHLMSVVLYTIFV